MADDFDPLTIPAVMPAQVPRTKEDGRPTEHAIKWEEGLQAWMKANVANTNTRLNLVSEEVDGAYAAIEEEATARADADTAIASQITTLTATVGSNTAAIATEATTRATADTAISGVANTALATANNATASAQIYWSAKSAPAGATASYGVFLAAGGYYGGLEIIATSGGGSAIGMTANQFKFVDAGTQFVPFSYTGGNFYFNTNVIFESASGSGTTVMTGGNIKIYYPGGAPCVFIGNNI